MKKERREILLQWTNYLSAVILSSSAFSRSRILWLSAAWRSEVARAGGTRDTEVLGPSAVILGMKGIKAQQGAHSSLQGIPS